MRKDQKKCPFCAEIIRKSAIKCRFCQSELISQTSSDEHRNLDLQAGKIANKTSSKILNNNLLSIVVTFLLISWLVFDNEPIKYFIKYFKSDNTQVKKINSLEELMSAPVVNIDPEKLAPIFTYFSDYTDLQREKIERDLKDKVVIWNLEVYDVHSTKNPNIFRIQTSGGAPKSESIGVGGLDKDLDKQLAIIMQGLSDSISDNVSGKKTNHNVGTFIQLYARDQGEVAKIHSLKTGSWIKIKGRIKGISSFTRSLDLDPAIFFDETKQAKVSASNAKDCQMRDSKYSFVSKDEIKSQNLVNYIDQSGKILVHYGQGNHSSDIEIFNLNTNTFTKKNNTYKENNESRNLSEKDLTKFNSYQSESNALCKFHYDLIVSDEFRCQLRGSNFMCDWIKDITNSKQIEKIESKTTQDKISWTKNDEVAFMNGCFGGMSSNKRGWCECVLHNLKNNFSYSQWVKIQENSNKGIRQDDVNQILDDIDKNKCSNLNR